MPPRFQKLIPRSLRTSDFQSATIKRWQPIYQRLFDSHWTLLVLLILGIMRVLFFLQAYAPADGADAMDYYTYAAYINGADVPSNVANVSPILPLFIYLNYYVLGNFNLMIVWQMVMSAILGLLYYLGLRRYNALLAVLVALIVIGDAQTGVTFNFIATEPLYIFLLACVFSLTLIQHQHMAKRTLQVGDILLGIMIVLLRETRTVARYIFVPLWVLFTLATRQWKRSLVIVLSFLITSALFDTATQVTQTAQQSSINNNMYLRPLISQGLLDASAGEASADLAQALETCRANQDLVFMTCLEATYGSEDGVVTILNRAYIESVVNQPYAIYRRIFEGFTTFLKLSGRQYYGTPTPADVQCEDIPARVPRLTAMMFDGYWRDLQLTDTQKLAYTDIVEDFALKMCPPAGTNPTIQNITDYISLRYRALSRPHPYRWYASLILLVLWIPWARKLWLPVFLAGGLLAYHAAISAAVFNVQPRYALVTNPFKAILLAATLVIMGYIFLKVIDDWLAHNRDQ